MDLNLRRHDGNTALHLAILPQEPELAIEFIQQGADIELKNHKKESANKLAKKRNDKELLQVIKEKNKENIHLKITRK